MQLIFSLTVAIVMVIGIGACKHDSDKSNVEQQNNERFDDRGEERVAQFVVDILDASYGLMEVAQLAEDRSNDAVAKAEAKQIVEAQTSMIIKLKAYAESKDISIPFSGPARTKGRVKKLYDKQDDDFVVSWKREIGIASTQLSEKIEKYKDQSDAELDSILDASLIILRNHTEVISRDKR
jgi:predicted outer membrane protein